jgi:peptidoglycan/xylan/chitin deacetylase (PgdA/CDA1 family)
MIVIFRDDDVQPYFGAAALKRLVEILDGSNIPITFGIIPNASGKSPIDVDKDQLAFLQGILPKESMYETALHGYTHMNATFEPTGLGVSEFAGLPLDRQRELLTQGLAILHSAFPSVSIRTFIPPFDSYDNNTLIALREQGFTVISTDDYTEAVLFGHPPPPRNLPPTPQSPDLPTSQPFILNGLLHLPANYETYNWTTSSFIPLEKQEQRFDLFYARPGSTFTLLLHHWLYTYISRWTFRRTTEFHSLH